jgi:hypothetical protein
MSTPGVWDGVGVRVCGRGWGAGGGGRRRCPRRRPPPPARRPNRRTVAGAGDCVEQQVHDGARARRHRQVVRVDVDALGGWDGAGPRAGWAGEPAGGAAAGSPTRPGPGRRRRLPPVVPPPCPTHLHERGLEHAFEGQPQLRDASPRLVSQHGRRERPQLADALLGAGGVARRRGRRGRRARLWAAGAACAAGRTHAGACGAHAGRMRAAPRPPRAHVQQVGADAVLCHA